MGTEESKGGEGVGGVGGDGVDKEGGSGIGVSSDEGVFRNELGRKTKPAKWWKRGSREEEWGLEQKWLEEMGRSGGNLGISVYKVYGLKGEGRKRKGDNLMRKYRKKLEVVLGDAREEVKGRIRDFAEAAVGILEKIAMNEGAKDADRISAVDKMLRMTGWFAEDKSVNVNITWQAIWDKFGRRAGMKEVEVKAEGEKEGEKVEGKEVEEKEVEEKVEKGEEGASGEGA